MTQFSARFFAATVAATLAATIASADDIPGASADVVATSAATQTSQCGARDQVIQELSDKYSEMPSAVGQIDKAMVIEIFRSREGNFTIISTDSRGVSCVVAIGQNWQDATTLAGVES